MIKANGNPYRHIIPSQRAIYAHDHFRGNYGIHLNLMKKTNRCQHVTGLNWKH